jgi:ATP-dependent Lhr-like helicase
MLDVVCLGGQMRWAAVAQSDESRTSPGLITFIARRAVVPGGAVPAEIIENPREQSIVAALRAGGAQYLDQISERANLSERDALAALWRLAARGLVSNDSFAPLRMLATDPSTADAIESTSPRGFSRHDAAIRARLKSSVSGRWSVIEAAAEVSPRESEDADPVRDFALRLLARNGILSREMLALEPSAMPWHDVSFALRRLEYGGTIRRGWFVRTLSAEQYALPEAVELLREARALNPAREKPIAISAADPANPYGAMLPGCGVARDAANILVLRAGKAVLGLASRALVTIGVLDDEAFSAAVAALIEARPKIVLDTIDGEPALASARVGMLAAMRFHSDGRALVFDGLPGPAPARAAHARRG